jgi:large subunit ribosomal protein L3
MGTKKGMMQAFDDEGNVVVCTVISAEPNIISKIQTKKDSGYESVLLSAVKLSASRARNVSKPLQGFFKKINVEPRKRLKESRVLDASEYAIGQEVTVGYFSDCNYVDVSAVTIGKGHQGVIKRHNFAGGPASHGSGFHRHGGSCGMRTTPGRCLPGQKKSGRMGGKKMTVQNLRIVRVDEEKQVILVEGAVPGARESLVYIAKAKKMSASKQKKKG